MSDMQPRGITLTFEMTARVAGEHSRDLCLMGGGDAYAKEVMIRAMKPGETLTVAFPLYLLDTNGTATRLEAADRLLDDPRIVGEMRATCTLGKVILKINRPRGNRFTRLVAKLFRRER